MGKSVTYQIRAFRALIGVCLLSLAPAVASAALKCDCCHEMPPLDSPAGTRDPASGAIKGNHQTHAGATADSCAKCHGDAVMAYTAGHRDKLIQIRGNINNSPAAGGATYSRGFFNQTSLPPSQLGTCANVNCHFESATFSWGSSRFVSPGDCARCHGIAPNSGNHPVSGSKHGSYYGTGTGSCSKCHPDHTVEGKPFSHATSATNRGIAVQFTASPNSGGTYSGDGRHFLPSENKTSFGTCTNLYCHSPGTKSSAPFPLPNQTATWGGTLQCGDCHGTPGTGSHTGHLSSIYGVRVACYQCHRATVTPELTISSPNNHVNRLVDVAFNSMTTAISGKYAGLLTPMQKEPGSAYANCENVYCHSNAQGAGGTLPPAYSSPTWAIPSSGKCGTCHDSGYHGGGAAIKSGSHDKHMSYGFMTAGYYLGCTICHYGDDYSEPSCSQCHNLSDPSSNPLTVLHVNHRVDISFVTKYGGLYNGTPQPGDGYSTCVNTYCHSNGTSVATAVIPANSSPVWGSGPMACNGCHGYPPDYASGAPKANSHAIHAAHSVSDCSICHYGTTTTGNTITDVHMHVNKAYDVQAKPGYTFTYVYNSAGGSCSSISCHDDAPW